MIKIAGVDCEGHKNGQSYTRDLYISTDWFSVPTSYATAAAHFNIDSYSNLMRMKLKNRKKNT